MAGFSEKDILSQKDMAEVMNMLETEPSNNVESRQPDIPTLREQLAILVSTGRAEEVIGVAMIQEQVNRLEPKDVENYYKRYETYVGTRPQRPLSTALSRCTPAR